MESDNFLWSQHIEGDFNHVCDLLSFEGTVRVEGGGGRKRPKVHPLTEDHPSNEVLTRRFLEFYPQLVPKSFRIVPLDKELFCWASQAAQIIGSSWTLNKNRPTRSPTELGVGGRHSVKTNCQVQIPFLMEYPQEKGSTLSEPSSEFFETESSTSMEHFCDSIQKGWRGRLSELPPAIYHRRSGCVAGAVPCTQRPIKKSDSKSSQNFLEPLIESANR